MYIYIYIYIYMYMYASLCSGFPEHRIGHCCKTSGPSLCSGFPEHRLGNFCILLPRTAPLGLN